jgi:hypothetical protein
MLLILLAPVAHELGHFLTALVFGHVIKFRFEFKTVPRFVWNMPDMERWKQRIVAAAGFGLEFALIPLCGKYYAAFAVVHIAAYRFYVGECSDFKWFGL